MKDLKDLLQHMLKDLWSAEDQMLEAYDKMAQQADSSKLKQYFQDHIEETKKHKAIVEGICDEMGIKHSGEKCKAMAGLVEEALGFLKEEDMDKDVLDAGMIAQAQRIEHYEITGYGTARRFAEELKLDSVEKKLKGILDAEHNQDDVLTKLAESRLNKQAK
ncbi:MAG: DUF892 family protein [Tunicatimonas sp.]|uniref:YciE/YciF ferroxidase family protein n=1 Tax=Tunicatimonas sp. TaxID=1940096 RepID=UPI003C746319